MNERIKKLRKALDLTQQKFADKIGVKRNTVAQWEIGINPLTNQVITSICREFGVSEKWLRDGSGEMFEEIPEEDVYSRAAAEALKLSLIHIFIQISPVLPDRSAWFNLNRIKRFVRFFCLP